MNAARSPDRQADFQACIRAGLTDQSKVADMQGNVDREDRQRADHGERSELERRHEQSNDDGRDQQTLPAA